MRILQDLARAATTEGLDEHGSARAVATTLLAIAAIACTVALLDGAPSTALVASAATAPR